MEPLDLDGLREAVIALPEPTLGLKGGVNRAAVLELIDAARARPDSLGEAWREAEEALAGRGHLSLHPHFGEAPDSEPVPLLGYRATVWADERFHDAYADTPVQALQALAAKLREQTNG